ncbi:hypothetical protein BGZ95_000964 [Linnemannia exigua]|uniref:C3H1-type domain-containing protein n=1 Tax=Linnemannia exigua TaxID=604196 RepID=A0AAD4D7I0_9FUNG|nr:hypothetical protein BGZ95_000964 [Linnemannia exigua]
MSNNSITSNNAVRLGAAALLGTVILYFIFSSTTSSSSGKPKDRSSSSSKTTTTTTTTTTTEKKVAKGVQKQATEEHQDKAIIDETPAVKAEKISDHKEHEEKPRETEPLKAPEVVPEPIQEEPVVALIPEPTIEKEVQQQEAQVSEIIADVQEAAVEETVEEEQITEREIPVVAAIIPIAIKEPELVKEEVVEEAVEETVAAALQEPEEVQSEEVEETQDTQIDTPTTLVGDQLEHTIKETEEEEEEIAQAPAEAPRKPESWNATPEDKVQTLQEVSRVAQHSELNAKAAEFKPSWLPAVTAAPVRANGVAANGAPAQEPVKMKSRCRFWPNCTNKSCKFTHPSTYCRDPENCSFGDRCNFIHPNDMTSRPPRDKGDKKGARRQNTATSITNGDRKGRPKSSDSSVNMIAASPVDAWSK